MLLSLNGWKFKTGVSEHVRSCGWAVKTLVSPTI